MVDVIDMNLNEVVKLIRGRAGTVVRLAVIPEDTKEKEDSREKKTDYTEYTITRAKIELKDSEARGEIIPCGDKESGSLVRVGYIDLPSFYMDMEGARKGQQDYKSTTRDVRKLLGDAGYRVVNTDITIVAEAPRMAGHIPDMRDNIATDLGLDAACVSVKATTSERMGFTGRGEGIAAFAVVLIGT